VSTVREVKRLIAAEIAWHRAAPNPPSDGDAFIRGMEHIGRLVDAVPVEISRAAIIDLLAKAKRDAERAGADV